MVLESPTGTTAIIGIPKKATSSISANNDTIWKNGTYLNNVSGISWVGEDANYIKFSVEAGKWQFDASQFEDPTSVKNLDKDKKNDDFVDIIQTPSTIDISSTKINFTVAIFDLLGRQVKNTISSSNSIVSIPKNTLLEGAYLVMASSKSSSVARKITIVR
jgi:hypothetical protein